MKQIVWEFLWDKGLIIGRVYVLLLIRESTTFVLFDCCLVNNIYIRVWSGNSEKFEYVEQNIFKILKSIIIVHMMLFIFSRYVLLNEISSLFNIVYLNIGT